MTDGDPYVILAGNQQKARAMDNVLLLNVTYAPLRVISFRRAMILLLQEKAEIVEEGTQEVRSAKQTFILPSVIRLNYMVNVPFKARVALNRRSVIARDKGVCQYGCGRKATTIDHVQPRSRGGSHSWDNVAACCGRCNAKKADKLLSEIGWELLNKPQVPTGNLWLIDGIRSNPDWEKYLF